MDSHKKEFKIFNGNSNPGLAADITRFLRCTPGKAEVGKFSNGETSVVVQESIRALDVYIVQSTCSNFNQINFVKHARNNSTNGDSKSSDNEHNSNSNNNNSSNDNGSSDNSSDSASDIHSSSESVTVPNNEEYTISKPHRRVRISLFNSDESIPFSVKGRATPTPDQEPSTKTDNQEHTSHHRHNSNKQELHSSSESDHSNKKVIYSESTRSDCDNHNWNVNDAIMELLIMGDAFKRASCNQLVAVIPFFGYARQSKKLKSRTPITSKLVANMIQKSGFNRVITVDVHASQIQGFFDIPVDNLYAEPLIVKYIRKRIFGDKVVVAPGVGGVKRAKSVADKLDTDEQTGNKKMILVGDVTGKVALIIDDIVDTCETLEQATNTLLEKGASKVYALITHGVLSTGALEKLNSMPLTELVITNSIPNDYNVSQCSKLKVINIAPLLGEAIRRTNFGESLSTYFFK